MKCLLQSWNPADFIKNLDLSTLRVVCAHEGGSGGVIELLDANGQRYMLKFSDSEEHLKKEILSDTLHRTLGVKVPDFAAYEGTLPEALLSQLEPRYREKTLCRLSKKIAGSIPSAEDLPLIQKALGPHFVAFAYLGNRDIAKWDNLIITEANEVYCIDNGSFLSTRALGKERQSEEIYHVIELATLRDPAYSPLGALFFGQLSDEEIDQQIKAVLEVQHKLVDQALAVHHTLAIEYFTETLREELVRRLESLNDEVLSHPEVKDPSKEAAVFAAGIFSIRRVGKTPYVLLGCRTGTDAGTWCNPGGTRDLPETPAKTAAREVYEESFGLIKVDAEALEYANFIEVDLPQKGTYRLYFMRTDKLSAEQLTEHLQSTTAHTSKEYTAFAWVNLADLLTGIQKDPTGETAIPVHVLTDREERDKQRAIPSKKKAVTVLTPLTPYPNMRRLLAEPALQTAIQPFLNPRTAWQGPLREEGLRSELADRVIQQAELVREIPKAAATFFKSAANLEETSSTDYPASKPARSFSELHLNTLLGDANDQNPLPVKVKQYLAVTPLQMGAVYDADYEAQMVKAIETEAAYQERGYLTLYHAVPREVAVLYDLYTAVTQHLSPSATQYKLRWGEMPFKHFQNIETFMEHFREVGGGTIDNYTQDFADMGASANLPIFGSPQHHTSASYYLFGQNTSSRVVDPFAEGSILQKGFMVSGLSLEETQ